MSWGWGVQSWATVPRTFGGGDASAMLEQWDFWTVWGLIALCCLPPLEQAVLGEDWNLWLLYTQVAEGDGWAKQLKIA